MPFRQLPDRGYELSNQQLSRSQMQSPLRDFLRHLAKRDRITEFYDFVSWGEAANFTLAQTATSTNFTVIDGAGGVMAGTTAATATASISAVGKTRFSGDANCMFEARFKVNTVPTTFIVEAGWVDAAPATGASFVTDIDTPSFVGTNGAVFGIWNNQTHTGLAFASLGSFTSQTVASTLLTTGFTTPVADTYMTVRVLLQTDPDRTGRSMAYCWVNGRLRASHQVGNGAVNGQIALYPWLYLQSVATTSAKVMTADYIWVSQDRIPLEAASE
ncbi:MAG TPA: hypothetical protein VMT30_09130 [Candidatus Saccharimonadia bacterium]|nr:hypothetical protein [Candidatus Saccharimonadia bacterium]